jgi:hypothetical protein
LSSAFICPTSKNGKITPRFVQITGNPSPSLMPMPFILGELNYSEEDGYTISYVDESTNTIIDVSFNPREVITISKVSNTQPEKQSSLIIP